MLRILTISVPTLQASSSVLGFSARIFLHYNAIVQYFATRNILISISTKGHLLPGYSTNHRTAARKNVPKTITKFHRNIRRNSLTFKTAFDIMKSVEKEELVAMTSTERGESLVSVPAKSSETVLQPDKAIQVRSTSSCQC